MISHQQVDAALAALRALLSADGYDLLTVGAGPAGVVLRIAAGEGACAECLVPSSMMTLYVRDALKDLPGGGEVPIEVLYPHPQNHSS